MVQPTGLKDWREIVSRHLRTGVLRDLSTTGEWRSGCPPEASDLWITPRMLWNTARTLCSAVGWLWLWGCPCRCGTGQRQGQGRPGWSLLAEMETLRNMLRQILAWRAMENPHPGVTAPLLGQGSTNFLCMCVCVCVCRRNSQGTFPTFSSRLILKVAFQLGEQDEGEMFKPKGDSDLPMLFPGKRCLVVGGGWLRPVSLTHPLYSKTLMTQDQKWLAQGHTGRPR